MSECFGPLLLAHAETITKEADGQGLREAKSQRTENGKGRGHQPPRSIPSSRRGHPNRQGQDVDLQQAVKALGRLVIQQETSIRVLRQDTSWVIFVQAGPQSSLFKGQAWKDNQQKGAVNRPFRCVLITCLMEHLLKILEDLKGPLLEKAQSPGWLTEAGWQYQTWSPSMGALMVNKDKAPVPPQQVIQELKEIIPLLSTPYMIHRFHANRAIKESRHSNWRSRDARKDPTRYGTPWKHSPIARCYRS